MNKSTKTPTLTEALKAAVENSGQSVNAIALAAGISQSQLARFVSGERDLRLATADRLAVFFGLRLVR
jgi:plasmid maintenance system antidote protein VapI